MPLKFFISYAHEDSAAKEAFLKECAVFKHENQVTFWSDDNIRAGDFFDEVLKNEITSCDACIIISSNNYWAKDYIREQELPLILQNETERKIKLIPILLNGANKISFSSLKGRTFYPQLANTLKAIDNFTQADSDPWALVFDEIVKNIELLQKNPALASNPFSTTDVSVDSQTKSTIQNVTVLIASPLYGDVDMDLHNSIITALRNFDISLSFQTLNRENLYGLDESHLILIFSKLHRGKIIIEDEYCSQELIEIDELNNILSRYDASCFICSDDNFSSQFRVLVDFNIFKRSFQDFVHKHLKALLKKGNSKHKKTVTPLPQEIDIVNLKNFIGRQAHVQLLIRKVLTTRSNYKVLTIKGAGGIGKTTLLKKVVEEIAKRGHFSDGISFIECENISDYADFEQKMTVAFEMNNAIDFQKQLSLQEESNRLIMLDNMENLFCTSDAPRIKELISDLLSYATIVMTSRESMDDPCEDLYPLDAFSTDEALEFFEQCYQLEKDYDKQLLRTEILENLLNNNPLAIRIITKTIPHGKNLDFLVQELQNDFFGKTSLDDDTVVKVFDQESDLNIEKSRSLYQSINYSYKRLGEKEQLALELLSLFPDGLDLENFKIFCNGKDTFFNQHDINDRDIRNLENKSLILNNHGRITLQSIIGRFAGFHFGKRDNDLKKEYYTRALEYNIYMARTMRQKIKSNSKQAYFLDLQKNNFLKVLEYFPLIHINDDTFDYLINLMRRLGMVSSPNKNIIDAFSRINDIIISAGLNDLKIKLFNIELLSLQYYYGQFEIFDNVKSSYPIENFYSLVSDDFYEVQFVNVVSNLYSLEGNLFVSLIYLSNNSYYGYSLSEIFEGGFFNLIQKYEPLIWNYCNDLNHFFEYEYKLAQDQLNLDLFKKYIKNLYKTEFIELIQCNYIIMKSNPSLLNKERINRLVHTNPYTFGLKNLMLAFVSENIDETKRHYRDAMSNLEHIKYYYVEAHYFYSRFLKSIGDSEYETILMQGKTMAQRFFYRYLLHCFNCLESDVITPYNEENYPLPEEYGDLEEKLNHAIKRNMK